MLYKINLVMVLKKNGEQKINLVNALKLNYMYTCIYIILS